jgi:hypothetical protein
VKSFLLWLLLALVFAGVYGMSADRGGWGNKIVFVTIAVGGVLVVAATLRRVREMRAFNADYDAALRQLAVGQLDPARATLWAWSERGRGPRVSAVARVTLGWTMLRAADLDDAIAVFEDNEKTHRVPLAAAGLVATNAALLAMAYTLRGDDEGAEAWRNRAMARHEVARVPAARPRVLLAEASWLCRYGARAEAAKLLDESWAELEATCTGDLLRPLRVVRAFAHADGPRSGGVAEAALPTLRPAYPGEYTFLGAKWPEMAAFLACHELT